MNEMIFETVISSVAVDGTPHVAPLGVRYVGDDVVLMPFRPSTTFDNIVASGTAVLNRLVDARVFAGCVTGRRNWPVLPAQRVAGVRLACALNHVELRLVDRDDDANGRSDALGAAERPLLRLARVHEVTHAPFLGINRAQAAVVEGAVLVSRLHLLPAAKVDAEMAYLQVAIDKTAGPDEREAWGWLQAAVARQRGVPVERAP